MLNFLRIVLRVLFRVTVVGEPPPPGTRKLLFIANHESLLDSLLLGVFLPAQSVVVVPPEETRGWWMRMVLAWVPHVVLELSDPLAVKKLIKLLDSGRSIALFPEGQITRTGNIMKVYDGPALIALRTGALIVPMHLDGPGRSPFSRLAGEFPRQWFPRIRLHMASAQCLGPIQAGIPRQRRRTAGVQLVRLLQAARYAARPRQTMFDAFLDAASIHGRRTRIMEDAHGNQESYGDLIKESLAFARWVCRFTREGEVVGVLLPNLSTTVSLVFGIGAAGRVAGMLNFSAGTSGLESACVGANIGTVISSRSFLGTAKLATVAQALGRVLLVYVEDFCEQFAFIDKLWLAGFAMWWPRRAQKRRDPGSQAVVLFTSGSEDRPKGVALSHNAILANVAQIKSVIDFGPNDKFLNALPMYHAYGFTGCTILPLLIGARLLLYTSPLHYRMIPELVYRRNCTCLFGTSAFLGHYAKHALPYDVSSLRYVVSGGEKLSEEVRNIWLEKFGLRIFEGYGTVECAPVLALNTPLAYKRAAVGRFLPGIDYRLEPVPGIERGGILHVYGPNIMLGYYLYSNPGTLHRPPSVYGEGWHNTGDVVEVDEEGFVTIKGRVKRFAKVAGEMISLEVVENIASHASPGYQHASTLQADTKRGEIIVLFTTDPNLSRASFSQAARQMGVSELAIPRKIMHVRELPLLGSGKTDYLALSNLTQAQSKASPAKVARPAG